MRSDTFCTNLGARSNGMARLWIEDSYHRLTRNNFSVGTQFTRRSRPGYGVILEPNILGEVTVSTRRGAPLLSLENSWLANQMPAQDADVRVRVSVGNIVVMPRLRTFHVGRRFSDEATIVGNILTAGANTRQIDTLAPASIGLIGNLTAHLDWTNLVYATEVMGNARPECVALSGDVLCIRLAGKFLADGGYSERSPGLFIAKAA